MMRTVLCLLMLVLHGCAKPPAQDLLAVGAVAGTPVTVTAVKQQPIDYVLTALGSVGESSVAESLFISRRTLVRRLAQENTSFKLVREELLASIAAMHLQETMGSVESIAVLLNYHDSSNFRRAFKKWFNMTPDEYRRINARCP